MGKPSKWLHGSSLANAAQVAGIFVVLGIASISFGLPVSAGRHYLIADFMYAVGSLLIVIGIAWFFGAGVLLARASESETASQHEQDIRTFAAEVRKMPFPFYLHDSDAREKLLRSAMRSHVPELAALEDQLSQWQEARQELAQAMRRRAEREAAALFGEDELDVGTKLMSGEAERAGRSGQPHFDYNWTLEMRDDGNLWFGAFNLGKWHLQQNDGDVEGVRRDLMGILRAVDDWDEVRAYQQLPNMQSALQKYDELLARISLASSLMGKCQLCS
jgi:hypothetical protein